jgi:Flp pilus assembly protein protease CpaA
MFPAMILDPIRLIIGGTFLLHAAILDIRTRRVPNIVWMRLGAIAVFLLFVHIAMEGQWYHHLVYLPLIPLFAYAFIEVEQVADLPNWIITKQQWDAMRLVGWAGFILLAFIGRTGFFTLTLLGMCIFILIIYGMYYVRLLHGGADAKGMMVLTLLVPFHPEISIFPLWESEVRNVELIFTFPVVILTMSVIAFAFLPIGLAVYNLMKGDRGLPMFIGYKMSLKDIPDKHVWLMDQPQYRADPNITFMTMVGEAAGIGTWLREQSYTGERKVVYFPKRATPDQLAADLAILKREGVDRTWITPKMPFMVAMLGGFIIAFLGGNLLFALMEMLMG